MQQRPIAVVLSFLVVTAGCGNGGSGEATPSSASSTTLARSTTSAVTTTSALTTTNQPTTTVAESTTGPLAGMGELELIEDRFGWAEGPQWLPDMGVLLITDSSGTIYQVDADDEISVFRQPSNGANGLALGRSPGLPPTRPGVPVDAAAEAPRGAGARHVVGVAVHGDTLGEDVIAGHGVDDRVRLPSRGAIGAAATGTPPPVVNDTDPNSPR